MTEISAKLHVAQPENDSTVPVLNIFSSSDCQYNVSKTHPIGVSLPDESHEKLDAVDWRSFEKHHGDMLSTELNF